MRLCIAALAALLATGCHTLAEACGPSDCDGGQDAGPSVTTAAGNGTPGDVDGTGGATGTAELDGPAGVAVDHTGRILIADTGNARIRVLVSGQLSTLAGTGDGGLLNGPAASAQLSHPNGVAVDGSGDVFIADGNNNCIRRIDAQTGAVTTFAGDGDAGFADGPAAEAQFAQPLGVTIDVAGNLYVADGYNNRIRRVDPAGTMVVTVAGTGTAGFHDGPGDAAELSFPTAVATDAEGSVWVADFGNNAIRRILAADGGVVTVAGSGVAGLADGPAGSALFDQPFGIAVDSAANVYVADYGNQRIRRISDGLVTTLAGTGAAGFLDGPAATAELDDPIGLAVDSAGDVFVADAANNRIRAIVP